MTSEAGKKPRRARKSLELGLENLGFTPDDVCRLLKTASKTSVRTIRWGRGVLEIDFYAAGELQQDTGALPMAVPIPADPTIAGEITRQALEDEEEMIKEAALDELLLRDPAEYERRTIDGSLVDDPTREENTAEDI